MELQAPEQAPAYTRLMEKIRSWVSSGEVQTGAKLPSVRKLAKQFGVCQATVSHACSELIREGLLRSEAGRGIFVAEPHRRAHLPIGLMGGFSARYIQEPGRFQGEFLLGVQRAIAEHDRELDVIGDVRTDAFKPEDLRKIGAAVIFENFSPSEIIGFMRFGIPFVVADMDMTISGVDSAVTDNAGGMGMAVREVYMRGARHLVYVHAARAGRRRWDPALDERLEGFRIATQALGLRAEVVVPNARLHASGRAAAEGLLEKDTLPDALLCFGDEPAQGALSVFREKGVRVPEDIQVTGFGDVERRSTKPHDLATIRFDAESMGRVAVELLLRRQADPEAAVELRRVVPEWLPGTTTRKAPVEENSE